MIETDFLKQLKKLKLVSKHRVVSSYAGGRPSLRQGHGIEPVDHRDYFPGDDLRFIDWRVYGRTERLYIKRFEEEKNLTTYILLDSSKSMDFKTEKITKFDYAGMLSAAIMYLVVNENEKFSLSTFNKELATILQPKRGKKHFFTAIDTINKQKLEGQTAMDKAVEQASKFIKTRSFVLLISDFLQPAPDIKKAILRLNRKTKNLIVIHIADPVELKLKWQGDVRLHDLETSEEKRIFINPRFRLKYGLKVMKHISEIQHICNDLGVKFFSFSTNKPVFDAVFEITQIKTKK